MEANNLEEKIIQVLSYFDVFEYPLTFGEIKRYLEVKVDLLDDEFLEIIDGIPVISETNGYYYFLGRDDNVRKRIEREKISTSKIAKAKIISRILSFIPTVKYIGLSGSLSMGNSIMSDDIDLFFITRKNTLWLTRFAVNILLILLGQMRKRGVRVAMDKICPNMFVDEKNLKTARVQQNLYTAHEIVQLKTLYDHDKMHESFLYKNSWINKFLPNINVWAVRDRDAKKSYFDFVFEPLEWVFYKLQTKYIKRHLTSEIVSKKLAMFHPQNKGNLINDLYLLKVKRYKELYFEDQWIEREDVGFYFNERKARILN